MTTASSTSKSSFSIPCGIATVVPGPDGRRYLDEQARPILLRPADFGCVVLIVQSDANDLAGARDWREQLGSAERMYGVGGAVPQSALDDPAGDIQPMRAEGKKLNHRSR